MYDTFNIVLVQIKVKKNLEFIIEIENLESVHEKLNMVLERNTENSSNRRSRNSKIILRYEQVENIGH